MTDLHNQASIDHASASHMNELLERYPMGNNPLFGPTKRIFSNGDRHWELNDLRLRLWGVAKVCKLHLSVSVMRTYVMIRLKGQLRWSSHLLQYTFQRLRESGRPLLLKLQPQLLSLPSPPLLLLPT
jgi:hypothetical protein